MRTFILALVFLSVPAIGQGDDVTRSTRDDHWPQWRGPLGTGVSPAGDPAVEWSEDKNVQWKIELAGRGHSTPVVWGANVFLTAAVPFGPHLQPRKSGRPGAHDNLAV
jgi:outer membrane protein assembly factor BamB